MQSSHAIPLTVRHDASTPEPDLFLTLHLGHTSTIKKAKSKERKETMRGMTAKTEGVTKGKDKKLNHPTRILT